MVPSGLNSFLHPAHSAPPSATPSAGPPSSPGSSTGPVLVSRWPGAVIGGSDDLDNGGRDDVLMRFDSEATCVEQKQKYHILVG